MKHRMIWKMAAACILGAFQASGAEASVGQQTAVYEGIAIVKTTGGAIVRELVARGATKSTTPLYQYRTKEAHPSPSGDAVLDERLAKIYKQVNDWDKVDIFATGFETRLRRSLPPYGEAEIEINTCPADDRISSVLLRYPATLNTMPYFAKITRGLTSAIGRGPDETSSSEDGNILVDWRFADGTGVRAAFYAGNRSALVLSDGVAPITVSYLGLPVVRSCALNFVPRQPR